MSESDSSSLSSAPPTDDEAEKAIEAKLNKPTGIQRFFKPATKDIPIHSPPAPKRAPSPPHEYVLADNSDVAFLTMFRARFHDAFPRSVPHFGPQDIETSVVGDHPGEITERLLCALLGLALNRKKEVERAHYGRALEEAISSFSSQWPAKWKGVNPLHGGGSFNNMTPEERLTLLRYLALWSLCASDTVQSVLKEAYKQSRHDDDKNQPRSVQPWFIDTFSKRRYYLCEGMDDTHFRLYRENSGITSKTNSWFSVAGSIEEITAIADKFDEEKASQSKIIAGRIRQAVPRFEAGLEKQRRRDYRLARKAAFQRPVDGFSLYEGRTRGKRMKYTFSEDDDDGSDTLSTKRSARNSGIATPLENAGPTFTASGRQVKSRLGGLYGEALPGDQKKELDVEKTATADEGTETSEGMPNTSGHARRPRRQARPAPRGAGYGSGVSTDDESKAESSGKDWSGNEDEPDDSEPDFEGEDEDEEMSEDDSGADIGGEDEDENTTESLVVRLPYRKGGKINGDRAPLVQLNGDRGFDQPCEDVAEAKGASITTNDPSMLDPERRNCVSSSGETVSTSPYFGHPALYDAEILEQPRSLPSAVEL